MESTPNLNQPLGSDIFNLQLDGQSVIYLRDASKWAKFIAIVGFVLCGLMALAALFLGSIIAASMPAALGAAGGTMITIIYLLMAALWFFPCLYLFRFANNMKRALNNNEQDKLVVSFQNLKSHYRFIGILIVIMLCFYALAIIGGIIAAVSMGMSN